MLSYFGHTFKWPVDSTVETNHESSTYYSSEPNGILRGIIKLWSSIHRKERWAKENVLWETVILNQQIKKKILICRKKNFPLSEKSPQRVWSECLRKIFGETEALFLFVWGFCNILLFKRNSGLRQWEKTTTKTRNTDWTGDGDSKDSQTETTDG